MTARGGLVLIVAASLVAMAALAACSSGGGGSESVGKVKVVTSLSLFADLIRNVGGDRVQVTTLVPGDADPHTYEPVPKQAADISKARVIFLNGLGLEATLNDLVQNNHAKDAPVIEMTEGLPTLAGDGHGESSNPHLWMNAQNTMRYVENIRDGLIKVDPEGEATYRANSDAYLKQLAEVDSYVEQQVQSIPADRRKIVTFHDSLPYFAERYGMEVLGVVVESPGGEPSAGQLADLQRAVEEAGVPAVFKEPGYSSKVLDQVAQAAGAKVLIVTSHGKVPGEDVSTYVKMMRFDAEQLEKGLR